MMIRWPLPWWILGSTRTVRCDKQFQIRPWNSTKKMEKFEDTKRIKTMIDNARVYTMFIHVYTIFSRLPYLLVPVVYQVRTSYVW